MHLMARPRKEIDQKQFENLCGLQCTLEEICSWFGCCSDTLESWCKRTYKRGFSEVFREKRGLGKISLRRSQWRLAEKSATMAIWLGRNYLGQSDADRTGEDRISQDMAEDNMILREMFKNAE